MIDSYMYVVVRGKLLMKVLNGNCRLLNLLKIIICC